MTNVDPPAFIARMADTVAAMRGLCSAIASGPARHGNLPSAAANVAMSDLQAEARFAERFGEDWLGPVRDTQTFGGMTLVAASDYGQCYAELYTGDRAPVYGHLVLARAGLEACVISSWLNDPRIDTMERIKPATEAWVTFHPVTDSRVEALSGVPAELLGLDAYSPARCGLRQASRSRTHLKILGEVGTR